MRALGVSIFVLSFSVAGCSSPNQSDGGAGGSAGSSGADGSGAFAGSGGKPACAAPSSADMGSNFFTDISAASGIQAANFVESPAQPIPINDHSRIAFADIDGDGCDDVVAHSLFPNVDAGIPFSHLVYRSRCDGTFENFTAESGLADVQAGSFAFADVDNDGDADCFAALDIQISGQASRLFLNDGSGHFTPKADSGVESSIPTANALFADFDRDGKLDLFLANGQTSYLAQNQYFRGLGDGTFVEATDALGGNKSGAHNGAVACDYDDDGDQDIFVAVYGVSNDGAQNELYENDGHGNFVDVGVARGIASLPTGNYALEATGYGKDQQPGGGPGSWIGGNSFGIHCGDIDGDGDLDLWQATISHPDEVDFSRTWSDPTALLINSGAEGGYTFTNQFLERGLPFNEGDIDAAIVDFDNDGRSDLSLSRTDKYETNYTDDEQKGWFGLFHQKPDGRFESVGLESGINDVTGTSAVGKAGQNLAWSDVDRDGDLDLLVGGRDRGAGRANMLFRNDVGQKNGWLAIRLRGDGKLVSRDAIGARVVVRFHDRRILVREVQASRGTYTSSDTLDLHFGLADQSCDFAVEVTWPDGTQRSFQTAEIGSNRRVTIDYVAGVR